MLRFDIKFCTILLELILSRTKLIKYSIIIIRGLYRNMCETSKIDREQLKWLDARDQKKSGWVINSPETRDRRTWSPNKGQAAALRKPRGGCSSIHGRVGSSGRWAARRIRDCGYLPARRSRHPTSPALYARIIDAHQSCCSNQSRVRANNQSVRIRTNWRMYVQLLYRRNESSEQISLKKSPINLRRIYMLILIDFQLFFEEM